MYNAFFGFNENPFNLTPDSSFFYPSEKHKHALDALEDFNHILRVNLVAPYVLAQCFAREHIQNGRPGSIIMIASLMSEAARPTTSPYTASKGGIRQLVRALAVDWALP